MRVYINFVFACGKIGHKKDACPHTIWKPGSSVRGENGEHDELARSRMLHATDSTTDGCGMSGGSGAATDSTLYRPWMIVTRKKSGQRISVNVVTKEGPTGPGKVVTNHTNGQGSSSKAEKVGCAKESINFPARRIFRMGFSPSGIEPSI